MHIKYQIVALSLLSFVMSGCINEQVARNKFEGGNYKLTLKGCDATPNLGSEDLRIERTNKTIVIHSYGRCMGKNHTLQTNCSAQVRGDSILLRFDITQKYIGSEKMYPVNNCVCYNIHKFTFDKAVGKEKPVALLW